MDGLNGIIIDGKVYEARCTDKVDCLKCVFFYRESRNFLDGRICSICNAKYIFQISKPITDKINSN